MNILKSITTKGIITLALFFIISANGYSQFPDVIINATKTANATELSEHFNSKIELVLPQKSGVFSSAQAKLVINDFFKKNPVTSFKIIHQGVRENSSFAIGKYQTSSSAFRLYFLTKKKNARTYIHQLRIEKQND